MAVWGADIHTKAAIYSQADYYIIYSRSSIYENRRYYFYVLPVQTRSFFSCLAVFYSFLQYVSVLIYFRLLLQIALNQSKQSFSDIIAHQHTNNAHAWCATVEGRTLLCVCRPWTCIHEGLQRFLPPSSLTKKFRKLVKQSASPHQAWGLYCACDLLKTTPHDTILSHQP